MIALVSAPTSVQSTETDDDLQKEVLNAPIFETVLRSAISLRGHLVAALTTMREMAEAAKDGDLETVKMLGVDAEALIAENQMLGMLLDRAPSMPAVPSRVTQEDVEIIFGAQRVRVAARDSNRGRKGGR